MLTQPRGFTLVEVLMASVIASIVATGTVAAVVTASRVTRTRNNPTFAEAAAFAQQTAERFRNQIGCDNADWFDANCQLDPTSPEFNTWRQDPMTPGGGSEQLSAQFPGNNRRCYRLTPDNCNGGAGTDCVKVEVRVCWNTLANCPC